MDKKPIDRFKARSLPRNLLSGDWDDLTIPEIAEVFETSENMIRFTICRVRKLTGYSIPYKRRRRAKKGGAACPASGSVH